MSRGRPVEKLSRRAGVELGLKGARQLAGKSGRTRRPYPPGQKGRLGGQQGRRRQPEATGEELLRQLERRLDNVVYRLGFAGARAQARQFVTHGHVRVNGQRVNRPADEVRPQDVISIKPASPVEALVRDAISLGFRVPEWLAADHEALSGRVLHQPQRPEVDVPADENRVVEFFAKF